MRQQHYFICQRCDKRELPKSGPGTYPGPWCDCAKLAPRKAKSGPTCGQCFGPALVGMRFCKKCHAKYVRARRREALNG
jgi:hypothetical protein